MAICDSQVPPAAWLGRLSTTRHRISSHFRLRSLTSKSGAADGATFVIERVTRGLTALGGSGGSLGYGAANPITPSFALAINIYSGHAQGTEFVTNGNLDFNYSQTNIDTSLDNTPIRVDMSYAGGFSDRDIHARNQHGNQNA